MKLTHFQKFERVRKSGLFNMLTDSVRAAEAAGLTREEYFAVLHYYRELMDKWPDVRPVPDGGEL